MADFALENRLIKQGFKTIIGVDEVGRGPLAGPVVAAAVVLTSRSFKNRIDDSKKITEAVREKAFLEIIQNSVFSLGVVDEKAIDFLNILVATQQCMEEAVASLLKNNKFKKVCILVDGNIKLPALKEPLFNIIKGDAKSKSIAAASILAKVSRDRMMFLYDQIYPEYGFWKHKGYPTVFHRQALRQFGPCPVHRESFSYV